MLFGSWRRAQRSCYLQILIARIRGLVCIIVWCSSLFFMSFSALGAESGKSLYDKIGALDAIHDAAINLMVSKGDTDGIIKGVFRSDWKERSALVEQLKSLAVSGDPESAFYWGYLNWIKGRESSASSEKWAQEMVNDNFKEALFGFRIASDAGVGAASWNIAVMYEQGDGVTRSKLAAAEWYSKAGHQYFKAGEREKALAALERIEEIDKKHPAVIKLRSVLYPPSKGK